MPALKIVLFVLLGLIISVFAVKNMELVEVSFYDFELNSHNIKVPLLIVILISLGFGFLLAWVEGMVSKIKLKSVIRRHEKTIEKLNADVEKLKTPALPKVAETGDSGDK